MLFHFRIRVRFMIVVFLIFVTYLICFGIIVNDSLRDESFQPRKRKTEIEYTLATLNELPDVANDLDFQRAFKALQTTLKSEQTGEPQKRMKIIIASTWRSGSTFLAEIISATPGSYYHYEPLMYLGLKQFGTNNNAKLDIQSFLNDLLNCNYSSKSDYLQHAYIHPDVLSRNARLWHSCSMMPRVKCYQPSVLNSMCTLFPVHVMKLVRVRLSVLVPLLKSPDVKIIWLVRDPRATINSRLSSVSWCKSVWCRNPSYLCNDIHEDFNVYYNTKIMYPNQIFLLRYEDIANQPYAKTNETFKLLGLPFDSKVKTYLDHHLYTDIDTPWSTVRRAEEQAKKWLKNMKWNAIVNTQYYCRKIMKHLGYIPFSGEYEKHSGNFLNILNLPR